MRNRIVAFTLMLVMLFSCMSLQVFATAESTAQVSPASAEAEYDISAEKMAEYFEKYGTIGKNDGGYNLTASELQALVGKSNLVANTEFEAWADYTNSAGNLSLPTSNNFRFNNDKNGERVIPVTKDGNHYFQWLPRVIMTHKDGTYFTNFNKTADGKYEDSELQAYVDAGKVEISDGQVYLKANSNNSLSSDYIQLRSVAPTSSNITTLKSIGATYTISFDVMHTAGVATGNMIQHLQSTTANGFEASSVGLNLQILADGTLQVKDPVSGKYQNAGYQFKDGKWAQISLTHMPRGYDGVRDIDANGNRTADYDDNLIQLYVNGQLLGTYTAIANDVIWTSGDTQVSLASDFAFYSLRIGQYSKGFALDDLRVYYGNNVELAATPHNLIYTHRHDLATNTNIITATCTDEGCDVSETIVVDLCNKNGTYGMSVGELNALLEASGEHAWVMSDFTDGKLGELSFTNGSYKQNGNPVIDWVNIAYGKDAKGNENLIWQRPVAKNPATDKLFTEQEVSALSEAAQARIEFIDGIPYYIGNITGEYVEYRVDSAAAASVKNFVLEEPDNELLGKAYVVTMDLTYYGGEFSPFQLRSYTAKDFGSLSFYPLKLKNNKLYVVDNGTSTQIAGVSIATGETIQLSYVHMPRGFDGKRDVVDGHSVGDDNSYAVYINGECVASGKVLSDSTNVEWEYTEGDKTVKVSLGSDFTVQFVRIGQVIKDSLSADLVAIDNFKIYTGLMLECNHHFTTNPSMCDWCGKKFDLQHCDICDGTALSENIALVAQNATVGDAIAYNAYLKLTQPLSVFTNETILLDTTAYGGTRKTEYKIADLRPQTSGEVKGLYKVTLPLRSIDMTRSIEISVDAGGSTKYYATANLNSYFDKLIETAGAYWLRSLIKAMKNYGAYAQMYFEGKNGNPDDLGALPNENLSELDKSGISKVELEDLAPYKTVITGDGVDISSLKLVLDSATELWVLFKDSEGITVTENGKVLTKHASDMEGYSYVSVVDSSPASYNKAHSLVFSDGEKETTVSVSAYSVIYLMLKSSDEKLVNLASSMYLLGKAAYEYQTYYVEGNKVHKQQWDEDGVLKILCIGNSFSVDAMEWIGEIAQDLGYRDVVFGNLYIGGCYIDKHIAKLEDNLADYTYYLEIGSTASGLKKETYPGYLAQNAIISENWDYISLQQGSARSYTATEYKNLPTLIDYVTALCPTAKLVWHMTWAYEETYAQENKGISQLEMYAGILECVQTMVMTQDEIDILIPNGTAIQNARTSYLGDTMNRDGYHLDKGIGRYIAALTYFAVLTGADISDIQWAPEGVDAAARAVAIESVQNAIRNPYQVTQSQYVTAPDAQ